jgi:hypothetical protein
MSKDSQEIIGQGTVQRVVSSICSIRVWKNALPSMFGSGRPFVGFSSYYACQKRCRRLLKETPLIVGRVVGRWVVFCRWVAVALGKAARVSLGVHAGFGSFASESIWS